MKTYKLTPTLDIAGLVAHAVNFDFAGWGWNDASHSTSLDGYLPDGDYAADLRNMLCNMFCDENFSLEDYFTELMTEFAENPLARAMPRLIDIRWAHHVFISWADPNNYDRDRLTEYAISVSLCPIHFCDWAGCFDDEDPECAQVRTIFPHSHDT